MSHHNPIHPWCLIRLLPNMQRVIIGRFPKRTEAEAHQRLLQQMLPHLRYAIVFEVPPEATGGSPRSLSADRLLLEQIWQQDAS